MKKIHFSLIVIALSTNFVSCKKDKVAAPPTTSTPSVSAAYTAITSTKWRQTHEYSDTTGYARTHLSAWPCSTTDDAATSYDTCMQTTKLWFKNDHTAFRLKGQKCASSMADTTNLGTWNLISGDTQFELNGNPLNVLEISSSHIKIWYQSNVTNSSGAVLFTRYYMLVFDPAP